VVDTKETKLKAKADPKDHDNPCVEDDRVLSVQKSVGDIEFLSTRTMEELEMLEKRLSPVLNSKQSPECTAAEEPPTSCELATILDVHCCKLRSCIEKIADILVRLEI
jgi:hypothetical protein